MGESISVTRAMMRCWAAICTVHPQTRPATMVVYVRARDDRRGYRWPDCWTTARAGEIDKVHIPGYILAQGAESVFQALLHEACHSIAKSLGIQDVSQQGRYHNRDFRDLAESVGLEWALNVKSGYVTTGLAETARRTFAHVIAVLEQSLSEWQDLVVSTGQPGTKKSSGGNVKLVCPKCQRIIRASRKALDVGALVCVPCKAEFVPG